MQQSARKETQRLLRVGKLAEAKRVAEAEIERIGSQGDQADRWGMRFVRAQVLAWQGRIEEALRYLEALPAPDVADVSSSVAFKMHRGSFNCYLGRDTLAHQLLSESENLAQKSGLLKLLGEIYLCRAYVFFRQGDYVSSSELYRTVTDLSRRTGSWYLRANGLWGTGKNLMIQGQYEEAVPPLEGSLAIFEAEDAQLSVSTVWGELAVCYLGLGDDEKALDLLRRCERLDCEAGFIHSYQVDLANIGNVYLHRRDYFTALSYYRRAISLAREIKDPVSVRKWTFNINLAYARIKAQVDEAHPPLT